MHTSSIRRRALQVALIATLALTPASALAAPSPHPAVVVGDTPADYPTGDAAPPTTIEVVRPERTIVHEANQVLPIALASLALVIALAGVGYILVRGPVRVAGSH